MRKKILFVTALLLTLNINYFSVKADEFHQTSSAHAYSGGYISVNPYYGRHWTQYSVNSGSFGIGAGIKIGTNPTQVVSGVYKVRVESNILAGPYDVHVHYNYNY